MFRHFATNTKFILLFGILIIFYVSLAAEIDSANLCRFNERSLKRKLIEAPYVALAEFMGTEPSDGDETLAIFKIERWLKASEPNANILPTVEVVRLPFIRGDDENSKRRFCLESRFMQTKNSKVYLFLVGKRTTRNNELTSGYVNFDSVFPPTRHALYQEAYVEKVFDDLQITPPSPSPLPTLHYSTTAWEDKSLINSGSIMSEAIPVYEILVDTDATAETPPQRAQIYLNESLKISCTVSGPIHTEAEVGWIFNGGEIADKEVVVSKNGRLTDIRIGRFQEQHQGSYECRVRKSDSSIRTSVIRLEAKAFLNGTLDDAAECSPEYKKWCNEGTCVHRTKSNTHQCICPEDWSGQRCQYKNTDIITVDELKSTGEYLKTVIPLGAVFAVTIIGLLIGFILYHRKTSGGRRSRRPTQDSEIGTEMQDLMKHNGSTVTDREGIEYLYNPSEIILPHDFRCPNCNTVFGKAKLESPIEEPKIRHLQKLERTDRKQSAPTLLLVPVSSTKEFLPSCEECVSHTPRTNRMTYPGALSQQRPASFSHSSARVGGLKVPELKRQRRMAVSDEKLEEMEVETKDEPEDPGLSLRTGERTLSQS